MNWGHQNNQHWFGGMGGGNWEMVAILQEIGQDMFSKTFLHTIVLIYSDLTTPVYWSCNDFGEFLNDFQWAY